MATDPYVSQFGADEPAGKADDELTPAELHARYAEIKFAQRRADLLAKYGEPVMVADVTRPLSILGADPALGLWSVAFRYPSREAAEAWHQLNADHYGHEPVGIYTAAPNTMDVIGVLSLRAQMTELMNKRPGRIAARLTGERS
jgi:hypothetical protein